MVVAVVGATGLVGRKMLQVLAERNFPLTSLRLFASEKSKGKKIEFKGKEYEVEVLNENSFEGINVALFSAGSDSSKEFAPIAAKHKCYAIDNSSAWRMVNNIPLVVPEVNPHHLTNDSYIIANPNCSTIQLMVALKPIQDKFGLKRVICSTYQSITGAGQSGLDKLNSEIEDETLNQDTHRIAFNTMFHPFADNGFTVEENKMINESRKILDLPNLNIAVTCVRLPIIGGHAESVNFTTEKSFTLPELRETLAHMEGLEVVHDIDTNNYPTPYLVNDKDGVFVGRLRNDITAENSAYMWVVSDNLRKGAATNAVQIAEKLLEMGLIK